MHQELAAENRVILFNTLCEQTYNDFEQIAEFGALCDFLISNPTFFHVAYRDLSYSVEQDFDNFCYAVWACRQLTIAVEEAGLLFETWKLPPPFQNIVLAGRHRNLSLFVTAQRASTIPVSLRAMATQIISFQQTEPRDIEWLQDVMGSEAEKVRTLPRYKPLVWDSAVLFSAGTPEKEPEPGPQDGPQ